EAQIAFGKALGIQEQLHLRNPKKPDYTWELARTYNNLGIVRSHLGEVKDAWGDYLQAMHLLEPLSDRGQELDRVYNQLANSLSDLGRTEEAKDFYNRAITSHQALLDHSPENRDYQLELHQFWVNLADLYRSRGQFDLAEKSWAESDRHIQALARAGPSLDTRIAKSHLMHASILEGQGVLALAEREYQVSIRILEQIDSDRLGSETQAYHQVYGSALDGVAHIYLSNRNWASAAPLLVRATKQNEYQSGQNRAHALAWDFANLAKAQVKQRRFSEAKENLEKMTTFLPELSADEKDQLVAQDKIVTDLISSSKNPVSSPKRRHR
ncbi:MAG TPA: tetratricopeptide repeat protein, partial [Candidatus Acidoferrum sp.]|nr:tetratricopeptide repeat protein [Candidatus Acidoferrum sp.]